MSMKIEVDYFKTIPFRMQMCCLGNGRYLLNMGDVEITVSLADAKRLYESMSYIFDDNKPVKELEWYRKMWKNMKQDAQHLVNECQATIRAVEAWEKERDQPGDG